MPELSMISGAYLAGAPVGSGRRRPGGPAAVVRRRGLPLLFGLIAVLAVGGAAPAHAQTVPVVADQYDVDLTVQTDGALAVVERLSLDFAGGPFRHGQRIISLARVEAIRDVEVGEPGRPYARGQNSPNTFNTRRDGDVLYVDWWFSPTTNASRVFEIRYRAEGALRIYPDGDQVYWQAIPGDLEYPVRAASVTVHTPGDAARGAAYPERRNVAISPLDSRTMRFTATALPAHSGLVVRVQFPHGLVSAQPPAWQAEADRADWLNQNLRPALNFFLLLLALLIPVAGLVALGVLWMTRGRDPGVKAGAPVLDTPPSDLPAPLVGTLLDEQADERDVVAALVDLANRGVLRIAPVQQTAPVPGWTADYEITRLTSDDAGLREYERQLLSQLLGDQTSVQLSAARQRFVAALPYLQEALSEAVAREGLFAENPARVRQRYLRAGIALLVLAAAGGLIFGGWLAAYADLAFAPFIGIGILGAALLFLAGRMPRRTRAGALAANRWNAFRRHLAEDAPAEKPDGTADVFERYLPYAIVFGLNRSWIDRFAAAGTPAPAWYGGTPVIVGGPGWYGGPVWYGGPGYETTPSWGGGHGSAPGPTADAGMGHGPSGPGGLQSISDSLDDMLNRASETFDAGFGSGHGSHDWSSGGSGDGGGWSGGGAGDFGGGGGGGDSGGGGGGGGSFD